MRKKIKIILVILISIAILIAILAFSAYSQQRKINRVTEDFYRCYALEDIGKLKPMLDREILFCLASHEKQICDLFKEENERLECLGYFYTRQALAGKDKNYCQEIENDDQKIFCLALLTNDESLCSKLSPAQQAATCRAVTLQNITECDLLKIDDQQVCKDNFYTVKAISERNIELCNKIESPVLRFLHCKSFFAPDGCINYYSNVKCFEKYIPQIAKVAKDSSICEEIPYKDKYNKPLYDKCISESEQQSVISRLKINKWKSAIIELGD